MAEAAILGGREVAGIFPGSYRSTRRSITVTCRAVVHDAGMIKCAIGEIIADCMARSAIGCRGRMRIRRLRLSYGPDCSIIHTAIVAGFAITADTRVRKSRRGESCDRMAEVTVLGRG